MNYILFDPPSSLIQKSYPFTLTRPFGELRIFGGTIKEFWETALGTNVSYLTRPHLSELYPTKWEKNNTLICASSSPIIINDSTKNKHYNIQKYEIDGSISLESIQNIYLDQRFQQGEQEDILVNGFSSLLNSLFSHHHHYAHLENLKNQKIDCSNNSFLNDDDGPILVEDDVTIMEGAMIRGPVHICKGSTIKMGAKIYGPTVIGPYCKIGGEVSNCIFLGYSNKSHDGFIGHSIIGEWCNIGAGTSNSNLKNDYGTVKMWDYFSKRFKDSQEQFLGLYMGDHSKCAINTSFNTGTTVGVNSNIFGSGFPRNFIPSFSWGGAQGVKDYNFEKAISVAETVMARRGVKLTDSYVTMLRAVRDITYAMKQ
ncbi:MAG: glucose-1-phosphate thymidylyltransferase [Flavobacteriales bacterium]|nr:glucose-1-phosphate thymidylyltransferase [Flavobacteriales bacterium]|tara:strand:- start:2521 stop:3627 length:1107 start_codon:yes stop_codon:yes gene_type:complete